MPVKRKEMTDEEIRSMGMNKEFIAGIAERNWELENIVGNLLIAEYQADKLKARVSERVAGYSASTHKQESAFVYKYNDKWFKITLGVEEAPAIKPVIE